MSTRPIKGTDVFQFLIDGVIGVEDKLPAKSSTSWCKVAVLIDGGVIVQTVFHADFIVFLSVARSDMDAARTGVQGDKGRQDEKAFPVNQGMAAFEPLHDLTGEFVQDLIVFPLIAEGIQAVIEQVFGQNQDFPFDLRRPT